jgi:predicted permease
VSQLAKLSLDVLYQIILPIFLVLGGGFVVGRKLYRQGRTGVNGLRTLSTLVFYVFAPCLVFSSLVTSTVGTEEVRQIGLFALLVTLVMGIITWMLAFLLRLSPPETSSLLLLAMFGNIGNYGLPLNELAFGQRALDRAVIYFVVSSALLFSLGIMVAASARGGTYSQTLSRLARVPIIYALLLAALVRLSGLPVPGPILKATSILAQGTVPLMLLILGMQLSEVRVQGSWRLISLVSGMRLLLAPLIAVPLAGIMGLTGLAEQVSIIEASMPSAVFTIILALEFNLALDLTTGVVFITTFISPTTLIPLISYLR